MATGGALREGRPKKMMEVVSFLHYLVEGDKIVASIFYKCF